tara:strand:+ start:394 stop:852 length:459 start_codon:yes stop_codon:yes gene_type:complete
MDITSLKRKPIPQAEKYELDECGFIYRNNKKLSQKYRSGKWYVQLRGNNGRNYTVDTDKLLLHVFGDEARLSREDIIHSLKAKTIEEFPRYAITSYGAVYCIDPPRRGSKAGERYLLRDNILKGKRYVTLYHADGRRRCRQVDKIVQDVWGY